MTVRIAFAACLLAVGAAVAVAPLRPFDARSMEAIRKAQAGRPFVLALWSIHCEPCVREMPVWRDLSARYPDIQVILVSTDPPGERERVNAFLKRHDPGGVQRWQYADEFEERIRHGVDPRWRGELPRAYFFDRAHRIEVRTGAVEAAVTGRWFARAARE
jgi:thiol-disulfide isomerase/thioredoxin